MNKIDSMSLFVMVMETGSFAAASRKSGIPISTLSRKISALESYLKVRLLNRSTRKLELTEVGTSYLASCKQILCQVEEAEHIATGAYSAPVGEITLTAPLVFGRVHLLPLVIEFLKLYPEINIRLILTDHNLDLLEEHIDLALRIAPLGDSTLMAVKLGEIRHVVCASPDYLLKYGTPQTPLELTQHACITKQLHRPAQWHFSNQGKTLTVPVRGRLSVTTAEAAIDAAISGIGLIQVLSYQVADMQKKGQLLPVLVPYEPPPTPLSLIHASGRMTPLKLRVFIDFLTMRLRKSSFI